MEVRALIAWVFNLDADLELAARGPYTPSQSVLRAMAPHVARLAASWLGPTDVHVDPSTPHGAAHGLPGRAFCPTPRALALLEQAGATPERHPTLAVLRAVNSRAFAASLGQTLPGAAFVATLPDAFAVLATPPPVGSAWRIKRAFGMAGRGQRVVEGAADDAVMAFLRASLEMGGVQLEPHVDIDTEYAVHGMVAPDGSFTLGSLVRQRCDAHGAWLATEPIEGALPPEHHALRAEAAHVATALHEAGYFGPFGVDAFTYRDGDRVLLQPRSEINARYSMGRREMRHA